MAKALIRDTEVYREADWSPFTQNHLDWYATATPDGNGYALAEDAPADAVASDFDITSETVTIGEDEGTEGATYETRTRLTATLNTDRYNTRKAQEVNE